jgi:hypothetical protein
MHPRVASILVAFWAVLLLAGCAKADRPGGPSEPGEAPGHTDRAMRVTIDMGIGVDDVSAAVERLRAEARSAGGYVGEATVTGDGEKRSASVVLHVPVAREDDVRASLRAMGDVVRERETAQDVTEQRADLDARAHNAREEEKRLLALLSDRTGNLADVIAVEKELASVRENVEKLDAEQRVMAGQVDYAAVTVALSTRSASAGEGAGKRIASAAREGVSAAWQFIVLVAMIVVAAAPTTLLLGAMAYAAWRLTKLMMKRRRAAVASH